MASPSSWETVSALIQAKQTRILYPAVHHGWNFLGPKTKSAKSDESWIIVPSEDFVVQLVHGATSILSKDPGFHDLVLMGLAPTTIQVQVGAKRKRGSIDDVVEGAMYLTSLTLQSSEDDDAYAESLIASCLTEEKVEGILEWKPSDEFRKSSSKLVAQLDILASNAEKLLSSKDCRLSRSSYNQVSHVRSDSFESPFPRLTRGLRIQIAYTFKQSLSNGEGRNTAIVRASGQLNAMLESGEEISLHDGPHASSSVKNDYSNSPSTSLAERNATFKNILSGWVRDNMWNPFACDDVFERLVHQVVDAGCIALSSKKLDAESANILKKEAAEEKINNYVSSVVCVCV